MIDSLIDIESIDFGNAGAVAAAATAIIEAANGRQMFLDAPKPGPETAAIRSIAVEWVRSVEATIGAMSAGDALAVAGCFDIIHCIAFGRGADSEFINRYYLAAFDAFIAGDQSVDEYALFRAVSDSINRRHDRAFFGKPLRWYALTLERWHSEFSAGTTPDTMAPHDARERTDILLTENLDAFEGRNQPAFKRALANTRQSCYPIQ